MIRGAVYIYVIWVTFASRTPVIASVANTTGVNITGLIGNDVLFDREDVGRGANGKGGEVYMEARRRWCYTDQGELLWGWKVRLALVPLFTAVGLVGNTLSFIIWSSRAYEDRTYTFYLKALAVSDNLTLLITFFEYFNEAYYCFNDRDYFAYHSALTCKLTALLRNVVYLLSSWLVVCFNVERYLVVCHPFKTWRMSTRRGALLAVVGITVTAVLSQVYSLVYIGVNRYQSASGGNQSVEFSTCGHRGPAPGYHLAVNGSGAHTERVVHAALEYILFSFLLRFFLPFLVVALCNGRIVAELRRKRVDPAGRADPAGGNAASAAVHTLYAVTAVFVLTLLPHAALAMTLFLVYAPRMFSLSSRQVAQMNMLAFNVTLPCEMLLLVNYALNFVLYGLTGKHFRAEFVALVTCRRYRKPSEELADLDRYENRPCAV